MGSEYQACSYYGAEGPACTTRRIEFQVSLAA
jgi:hypothetical protein